jgi:hypothetical protein
MNIISLLMLILLMKAPDHPHVFVISDKVSLHCTLSHESDEETEQWSIKEVIYAYPNLISFLNFNYIYANFPICELTDQEKGRESLCPPETHVLP